MPDDCTCLPHGTPYPPDLATELAAVLNRHSAENPSNTPDFILAQYVLAVLAAWNTATQQRENWYGRDPRPTSEEIVNG